MRIEKYFLLITVTAAAHGVNAQDSTKIFVTTGAGIIKSPGALSHVLHPSIAFNSGLELVNKTGWFVQGTVDFNSLKYNQRIKENGSPYLFQNTTSSLVMLAINGGKNFYWNDRKWFASLYTGGGYLNIGEPRLLQDNETIIRQEVSRKGSAFGKAGTRIGFKTKLKLLQTIYFDGSYWRSPLTVQGAKLSGVSLFLGLRMSMK